FAAGIGIESLLLVDKSTILSGLIFYSAIAIALLSPLLAIPRTINTIAFKAREEQQQTKRQKIRDANSKISGAIEAKRKVQTQLDAEIKHILNLTQQQRAIANDIASERCKLSPTASSDSHQTNTKWRR